MLELEPFDALALSLHQNPGVYALLVGSGLSRSAGIPTGWEITLDLVRRLAAVQGVVDEADWEKWYSQRYSRNPNYSEILDALAPTASERRAILHSYIEPTKDEKTRRPTKAHIAIAKLVADGVVRVVVTTNFDRLIENAIRDEGIEPTIIVNEDSLLGAAPIVHSKCVVCKLHGDYLDTRIMNTEAELSAYPKTISAWLDEIFDQFGLIVVGWSGEWDTSLRDAITRTAARRYPLYWTTRGKISPFGENLIRQRGARAVSIVDADEFFSRLRNTHDALQRASRPHPQTLGVAVALARKYCRLDEFSLEWTEFLAAEIAKIREFVIGSDYPKGSPTKDSLNALIKEFLDRTQIIRRAIGICARWGTLEANRSAAKALRLLSLSSSAQGGFTYWINLRDFPATVCFYWALVAGLQRENYEIVRFFLHAPLVVSRRESVAAVSVLPPTSYSDIDWKFLTGREQARTPISDLLFQTLTSELQDLAIDPTESDELFDRVEFLVSLEFAHFRLGRMKKSEIWFWTPLGRYIWHGNRQSLLDQYATDLENNPAILAGLFGGSVSSGSAAVAALREHLEKVPAY